MNLFTDHLVLMTRNPFSLLVSMQLKQAALAANDYQADIFATEVELVSKELNHFGGIASFFRDWAPGTLTGGA